MGTGLLGMIGYPSASGDLAYVVRQGDRVSTYYTLDELARKAQELQIMPEQVSYEPVNYKPLKVRH